MPHSSCPVGKGAGAPGCPSAKPSEMVSRDRGDTYDERRQMNLETTMPELEAEQIARAKESGRTPVVFVHGLWLLPSSWDRWAAFFEEDDFVALTPGWPDDPLTVEEAKAHPEVFAGKSIGDVVAHYDSIITQLD